TRRRTVSRQPCHHQSAEGIAARRPSRRGASDPLDNAESPLAPEWSSQALLRLDDQPAHSYQWNSSSVLSHNRELAAVWQPTTGPRQILVHQSRDDNVTFRVVMSITAPPLR